MITNYLNQYQIKRTWDIISVLSSQRLPMHRALGMLWSVGLGYFGFPSVLKDQSLTTRRAFAMVFLSPWSLEQRKYYWQPLEEMSAGMNLNLKRFCQGESDRNVIFYAWNIYKFQDALRQRGNFTFLLMQARLDAYNVSTLQCKMKTKTCIPY